jgi:hypothetical protein
MVGTQLRAGPEQSFRKGDLAGVACLLQASSACSDNALSMVPMAS